MESKTKSSISAEERKVIDKKLLELDKKLMSAKNAYFQVLVFMEIISIMEAEAFQHAQIVANSQDLEAEVLSVITLESHKQISELNLFIEKVSHQMNQIIPQALNIQNAMINSHQLKEKKIKPRVCQSCGHVESEPFKDAGRVVCCIAKDYRAV